MVQVQRQRNAWRHRPRASRCGERAATDATASPAARVAEGRLSSGGSGVLRRLLQPRSHLGVPAAGAAFFTKPASAPPPMTQPWSDCPPPFPHCAPNSPALQAAYRPSWFSFPIRRAGLSSAGMQPEGLNGARRERGRAPERTRLLATLPCLGQGALRRTAATLLACGKDASKGARPGSCTERFDPGASFCMQVTVARTRGTARFGRAPSPPGFSPRRRGYGGPCPHLLKGHRPLRIPSAAAFGTKRSTHAPLRASPPVDGATAGAARTRSRAIGP